MKILLSAGELSGEEHAAHVVRSLYKLSPGIEIKAFAGDNVRNAGAELVAHIRESGAIMGFGELFGRLGKTYSVFQSLKLLLRDWKPDLLLIVNYSDFNLRLAKHAKKYGVRVIFFIPPQVWAWRGGRVKTMKKLIDLLVVIYPFEREFYKEHGLNNVVFVGHPLMDILPPSRPTKEERYSFLTTLGLSPNHPVIALFPGSRRHELNLHVPVMIETMRALREKHPTLQGIVSAVSNEVEASLKEQIPSDLGVTIYRGESVEVLRNSDVGLIKSGTSNLQAACAGLPFVMFFIASKTTEWIIRYFTSIRVFSIVNILRKGSTPEFIQDEANPTNLCEAVDRILSDSTYRETMIKGFDEIANSLRQPDAHPVFEGAKTAGERVAKLVLSVAGNR